jgi:hypothetical protein
MAGARQRLCQADMTGVRNGHPPRLAAAGGGVTLARPTLFPFWSRSRESRCWSHGSRIRDRERSVPTRPAAVRGQQGGWDVAPAPTQKGLKPVRGSNWPSCARRADGPSASRDFDAHDGCMRRTGRSGINATLVMPGCGRLRDGLGAFPELDLPRNRAPAARGLGQDEHPAPLRLVGGPDVAGSAPVGARVRPVWMPAMGGVLEACPRVSTVCQPELEAELPDRQGRARQPLSDPAGLPGRSGLTASTLRMSDDDVADGAGQPIG